MNYRKQSKPALIAVAMLFSLAAAASATTLTGTVKNATTGKPAAGDEVALIALSQGMSEAGTTKTDPQGQFSFTFNDPGPHLVRVTHQGVNYFPQGGPIQPGTTTTSITIYDAAKKLDGITTNVSVMRIQSDAGQLQIMQLFAVKNNSQPPRALMSDQSYEFSIPPTAQIDQSIAQYAGGMAINTSPTPDQKTKGKFYFSFPIRPGETRFEVAYHLPYNGEAVLTPQIAMPMEHFVVVTPKSMTFSAKNQAAFSPMSDQPDANVQVSTGVKAGQDLAFRVSGNGVLQDEQQQGEQGGQQAQSPGMGGGAGAPDNRPGGGLGRPIDTPDPLYKYRWPILAGLFVLLAAGGGYVVSRKRAPGAEPVEAKIGERPRVTGNAAAAPAGNGRSSMLLEALKEELFQLELEKQEGRISAQEYAKAKAALDETLQRAVSRSKATTAT